MQGNPPEAFNLTKAQAILNEIGLAQIALQDEVNTSIAEYQSSTIDITSLEGSKALAAKDSLNDDNHESFSDQTQTQVLVTTYEALREQQSALYCGGSLAALVGKFSNLGASARCILKQVQKALKSAELMEDLAKADFRTVKTFITNNITAERLLRDILQQACLDKNSSVATQSNAPVKYLASNTKESHEAQVFEDKAELADGEGDGDGEKKA